MNSFKSFEEFVNENFNKDQDYEKEISIKGRKYKFNFSFVAIGTAASLGGYSGYDFVLSYLDLGSKVKSLEKYPEINYISATLDKYDSLNRKCELRIELNGDMVFNKQVSAPSSF